MKTDHKLEQFGELPGILPPRAAALFNQHVLTSYFREGTEKFVYAVHSVCRSCTFLFTSCFPNPFLDSAVISASCSRGWGGQGASGVLGRRDLHPHPRFACEHDGQRALPTPGSVLVLGKREGAHSSWAPGGQASPLTEEKLRLSEVKPHAQGRCVLSSH